MAELEFRKDGAQRHRCALSVSEVDRAFEILNGLPADKAGQRLTDLPGLSEMLTADAPMGLIAASLIGPRARPVRALLFDKTPTTNWSLPWHQDRTIVVRERLDTPGYGPWSVKAGLTHVAPPFHLLERMVTLRLHLDQVDEANAPLLIVPGSHRLGRVAESDIPRHVDRLGQTACHADLGDVWAYSTPILHASGPSTAPRRRRVLQVDYASTALDGDLEWLGV